MDFSIQTNKQTNSHIKPKQKQAPNPNPYIFIQALFQVFDGKL